jgi:hypothetical protein
VGLFAMIEFEPESLKKTKLHQYVVRFVLGGAVTAAAGLVADHFGPVIGGLFMAFPTIFPAAATMIERQEREKKKSAGLVPGKRGRMVAGVDAGGAALGTLGLIVFAAILWRGLPRYSAWLLLPVASTSWMVTAVSAWWLRRRLA